MDKIFCSLLTINFKIVKSFFCRYIGTRFDKLNEHMRYLLLREEHSVKYMQRKMFTHRSIMCINNYKRVFWIIM